MTTRWRRCLDTATKIWDDEHKAPQAEFHSFNTTGGPLDMEETLAALELVIATKGAEPYKTRLSQLLPVIQRDFPFIGWRATLAIPFMGPEYRAALYDDLKAIKPQMDAMLAKNPFGVPISTDTWAGSNRLAGFTAGTYVLHQAFPDLIGTEYTLRGFDYLMGRHPVNNLSLVSGIGTRSKLVAYGNNRSDYTFVPGGMVPGVLIIPPDFPELKENFPFLWYENEYVIGAVSSFILAANAAEAATRP